MADETRKKKRVAILGGGMGALSAAFQLSEHPDEYDVTVYQMGWRLGGQGASGRNLDTADRIEEHGLHVWFGFYENAFSIMRRVYDALGRPPSAPLADVDHAFKAINSLNMDEEVGGQRLPWFVEFPTNDAKPGVGGEISTLWAMLINVLKWMIEFAEKTPVDPPPHTAGEGRWQAASARPLSQPSLLDRIIHWLARLLRRLTGQGGGSRAAQAVHLPDWLLRAVNSVEAALDEPIEHAEIWLLQQAVRLAQALPIDHTQHGEDHHNALVWLIKESVNRTWTQIKDRVQKDDEIRRRWILTYLGSTCFAGILTDKVLYNGFDPLDKHDMTDWFYAHALVDDPLANDLAYRSAPTQTVYDLLFHYEKGDTNRPRLSAGVAVWMLLRMLFGYKGSVLWRMKAAMGDTIFAPLYLVMSQRGVKFEFFHRVANLGLSADKKSLETVTISRQVNLKVGEYDPLVLIKDLPCWPSEPLYHQIVEGEELKQQGVDLERSVGWTTWKDTGGEVVLKAGEDFDCVILGIGLGAWPLVCQELIDASSQWRRMRHTLQTVQTQAIQLWFTRDAAELGIGRPMPVVGAYVEPYASLTNFTDLLPRENWPEHNRPYYLMYSCGVMKEEPNETQANGDARAKKIALEFLKADASPLWPKAVQRRDPAALKWSTLVAPEDLHGEARFDAQYWHANVDPVERYVLSLPDTNQVRLKAGDSGFDRLILAGNWIDTGFNIACIETAVMSGVQAARVLTGEPAFITGERVV